MDSGLGLRRPAPLPPESLLSRQQLKQPSASNSTKPNGTVTIRAQSALRVASGKETVVVVQRKSSNPKRMPLLKKLKGRSGSSTGAGDGQTVSAAASRGEPSNRQRNSEGTQNNSNKKRSVFFKLADSGSNTQSSRPMIIRPGPVQVRKKAPPPRPPPPKINKTTTPTSCPPSYDEVLRADVDEFLGQMNGSRASAINFGRTPPRPTSTSLSSRTVSMPLLAPPSRPTTRPRPQKSADAADLLIDFDAPSPPIASSNRSQMQPKHVQSLLELDDIFGLDPFSPTPSSRSSSNLGAKYNLGPRVLPPGPALPLNGDRFLRSSSDSCTAINCDPWGDEMAPRRGSVPTGTSLGDNWLQSCLRESVGSQFQSSPPPALPPRPKVEDGFFSDRGSDPSLSPEPPAMTPPPVPPFPSAGVSSCIQDQEVIPPLPPRPKSYSATIPHAIALYDYSAVQNDDLSFKAGDVITLLQEVNDDWLSGTIGGREGLFPKNFVDIIVPLNGIPEGLSLDVNEHEMGPRCRAIYDFVGENDDELSFATGDVISLEERVGNDWFRGTLHGNEGLLPFAFVEVIEELPFEDHFTTNTTSSSRLCVATYDFVGESGELTFAEGDRIMMTGSVNDEWLMGKLLGTEQEGRFPKNFVHQL